MGKHENESEHPLILAQRAYSAALREKWGAELRGQLAAADRQREVLRNWGSLPEPPPPPPPFKPTGDVIADQRRLRLESQKFVADSSPGVIASELGIPYRAAKDFNGARLRAFVEQTAWERGRHQREKEEREERGVRELEKCLEHAVRTVPPHLLSGSQAAKAYDLLERAVAAEDWKHYRQPGTTRSPGPLPGFYLWKRVKYVALAMMRRQTTVGRVSIGAPPPPLSKVPFDAAFCRALGPAALKVWSSLIRLRDTDGVCRATTAGISRNTGACKAENGGYPSRPLSEAAVKRALARLRFLGLVRDLGWTQLRVPCTKPGCLGSEQDFADLTRGLWGSENDPPAPETPPGGEHFHEVYLREVRGEIVRPEVVYDADDPEFYVALPAEAARMLGKKLHGGKRPGAGRPKMPKRTPVESLPDKKLNSSSRPPVIPVTPPAPKGVTQVTKNQVAPPMYSTTDLLSSLSLSDLGRKVDAHAFSSLSGKNKNTTSGKEEGDRTSGSNPSATKPTEQPRKAPETASGRKNAGSLGQDAPGAPTAPPRGTAATEKVPAPKPPAPKPATPPATVGAGPAPRPAAPTAPPRALAEEIGLRLAGLAADPALAFGPGPLRDSDSFRVRGPDDDLWETDLSWLPPRPAESDFLPRERPGLWRLVQDRRTDASGRVVSMGHHRVWIGPGKPPRSRHPTEIAHAASREFLKLPPSPETLAPVTVRQWKPRIPGSFDDAQAGALAAKAWRGMAQHLTGKPDYRVPADPRDSRWWDGIKGVAARCRADGFAPSTWIAWCVDRWADLHGWGKVPPISWVFNPKRYDEHLAWFRADSAETGNARFTFSPARRELHLRWLACARLVQRGDVDGDAVTRAFFPGDSFARLLAIGSREHRAEQARYDAAAARHVPVWYRV